MFTAAAAAARNKVSLGQHSSSAIRRIIVLVFIIVKKPGEGLEETDVIINPMYGFQKKVKHPRKYLANRDSSASSSTLTSSDEEAKFYISRYYKYTINPNATYKLIWDAIVSIIVIYSIIMVPLQLSFSVAIEGGFHVVDWIIDVLFMIDIIVNFFTAYNDNRGTVYNNCMIVKHYLKTWFVIDLVSTIPFDKIFCINIYIYI